MVAEEEFYFRSLLHYNEYATVHHQIDIRAKDIYHLNSPIHHNILGHIDKKSVLCEHRVEGSDCILVRLGEFSIIFGYDIGILLGLILKRIDNNSLGQRSLGLVFLIKSIVDDEIERSTQVGHVTLERVVRIDGDIEAIDVQAIVRLEELRDVSIFISLHLLRWETLTLEVLVCLVAHGIHNLRTMTANHPTTFVV